MKRFYIPLLLVFLTLNSLSVFGVNSKYNATITDYTQKQKRTEASGYVYHDENKNGNMDAGEKGIADVAVSNGTDVTLTNAQGYYQLPLNEDAIIFVIKPKGWMTLLNKQNLPQFYHIHKPTGSPAYLKYKGVSYGTVLPDEANFPLFKNTEPQKFKMVVFGDPQPYSKEQIDFLSEDIVHELIGEEQLKFGITMGDIVGDNLNLFEPLNQAVAKAGIPWYNVMGNHDMNFDVNTDIYSDETFERVYGPPNYAFQYSDVHFIVLDDIIYEDTTDDVHYTGGFRNDQLMFVKNYLATVPKDELIVLNMHIPLTKKGNTFRMEDQKRLFALLQDFPHTLSISAHTHVQENKFFKSGEAGWQRKKAHHHYNVGTTSGSWWNGLKGERNIPHTMMRDGTPNGYAIITFDGPAYTIDWTVAGSTDDHKMSIHFPRGVKANSMENPLLTVNYFNGSEHTRVEYKIPGLTGWKKMEKADAYDPYFSLIVQRRDNFKTLNLKQRWIQHDDLQKHSIPALRIPDADKSTHIWQAETGTDFPTGRHLIKVKVTDRYGRVFTDYHSMRLTE